MNTICITGNLTAQPELKRTNQGTSVCSYTVAVSRPKVKDTTDFINCVSWRQGAEYLCKYAQKGSKVALTGVLTARQYTDRDGNKRTAFEVVADTIEILGGYKPTEEKPKQTTLDVMPDGYEEISAPDTLPF